MLDNFSGMKELYDVSLRLNKPLEISGKKYNVNESILTFKQIELSQIQEQKTDTWARGGHNNIPLVNWEIDKEIRFMVSNGVLSPKSWALLSNSQLKNPKRKSIGLIEELKTIEDETYCYVDLKYCPNSIDGDWGLQPNPDMEPLPMGRRQELALKPIPPSLTKWIYCYDMETGQKINSFSIYGNRVFFKQFYRKVMIDYTFTYEDKLQVLEVGNRLFNGFLRLDGKMSVKDEKSGEVSTAILEIPKIKLSSSLAIRLGKNYESSTVSDFYFIGYPNEKEGTVANITFLDKELTGDYI